MKRIIPGGILALGVAACGGTATTDRAAPTPPGTVVVQSRTVTSLVPVDGTVAARHRAEISTRLMARISSVVEIGSAVTRGQTLIRLGLEDIEANRLRAEAAVAAARAGRDEAARQAARMDTLLAADAVAAVQRDQAHLGLTRAESQLALAQAALTEVGNAERYSSIPAPFSGTVVARYVDPGDLANPGMPLVALESRGARDAVLAVPIGLAETLQSGDSIEISGPDGLRALAPVRSVAGGADLRSRTVEVRATVPATWPTGMAITGYLPGGTRQSIVIPDSVVVRRGQLTGVRVVSGAGTAIRWVRLGRSPGEGLVEVLSGLSDGDRVAP